MVREASRIAVLLAVLSVVSAAGRAQQLLHDGGFEDESLGAWQVGPFSGQARVATSDERAVAGARSLLLSIETADRLSGEEGATAVNPLRVVQVIAPAPEGRVVTAVAYAECDLVGGGAELRIEVLAAETQGVLTSARATWPDHTDGFVARTVRCYVSGGADRVQLSLEASGSGTVRFDEVSALAAAPEPAAAGENLLENPGFEDGAAGWVTFGTDTGAELLLLPEAARSGDRGARVRRVDAGATRTLANWGQEVVAPQVSGREVVFSAWLRAKGVTGRGLLGAYFVGRGSSGQVERFVPFDETALTGTTDWVKVEQPVSFEGMEIYSFWLRALLDGAGTLDLDDAAVVIAGPAAAPDGTAKWLLAGLAVLVTTVLAIAIGARRRGR